MSPGVSFALMLSSQRGLSSPSVQIANPPPAIYFLVVCMVCLVSLECVFPLGKEMFLFCS